MHLARLASKSSSLASSGRISCRPTNLPRSSSQNALGTRNYFKNSSPKFEQLPLSPNPRDSGLQPTSNKPGRGVGGHIESEVKISSTERGSNVFAYRVLGMESQVVELDLHPNEVIRAEVGSLLYMTQGVEMETKVDGFSKGITRVLTGESFFISDFRNTNADGVAQVAFGGNYPCKVLPLRLDSHGGQLICQKGAFLCGAANTQIEMFFTQRFAAGFFGGEGFILQQLVGDGLVLLKGGGATIVRDLAPGEVLRVASGSIIAFERNVQYDVQMVKGAKNILFGGEGLFFTQFTGPGRIWLQGLSFDKVVGAIAPYVGPSGIGTGAAVLGGLGGAGSRGGDAAGSAAAGAAGGAAGAAAGGAGSGEKSADDADEGDADAKAEDDEEGGGDGDGDGDGGGDGEGGGVTGFFGSLF